MFGCFNRIGIFGKFNKKMYLSQPKFVWFNLIFIDIQQNSFVGSRKILFYRIRFGSINKKFVSSTIESCCYIDNKMFGWFNKIFGCFNQTGRFGNLNQKMHFNQSKFVWFNQIMIDIQQNILLGYRQQKVSLTQQNISLIQTNCLFILTKSEYLVDSNKKCI